MIVGWVVLGVAGAIAVVVLVTRALAALQRRRHRQIVSGDHLDVQAMSGAFGHFDPPPTFVVTELVDAKPYDQDAD